MFNTSFFRYPYDEAATVAISTIKEFQNDFKEVVLRSIYSIFFIWSELYMNCIWFGFGSFEL